MTNFLFLFENARASRHKFVMHSHLFTPRGNGALGNSLSKLAESSLGRGGNCRDERKGAQFCTTNQNQAQSLRETLELWFSARTNWRRLDQPRLGHGTCTD